MYIAISSLWLALVAWLIGRAFRQRHALPALVPGRCRAADRDCSVAVVVPARDEEHNIGACLASILGQDVARQKLRVLVVDDRSTDDTARIVRRLAAEDPRIELLRAPELPSGWTGKAHACWLGANALPREIEWLCFIDADMRAQPQLLTSAIGAARSAGLAFLSLAPRHELRSFAERLMLPCGLYLLGFCQDLTKIQCPESADAVATGQFILVRRESYDEVDGFRAVRARICEDVALARLMKRRGHRVVMQDGSALLTTRMYDGWRSLWPGIAKNLSEMLGGPTRTLLIAATAVTLAWLAVVLPIVTAVACAKGVHEACIAFWPAAAGSAALFALHIAGAHHFRIPLWYGLLFPIGYSIGAVIALDSVRWRLTGQVRWKGRVYQ
ncbi:MAG TPA: glycosyltransferase family A protein [Steroidobacteraceae bacterium]|jgi:chlorobactene glucosyltransferase|nr:glycosyltransferase family A protein [Steroidobacteraceae bacterium]